MQPGIMTFALALAISFGITIPVRQLALRLGMVDLPDPRKVHRTPMPLMGGFAIYAGAVLATFFSLDTPARRQVLGMIVGATLLLVVGTLDDRGLLHHQLKLVAGMPTAAVLLLISGIQFHIVTTLLPGPLGRILDIALTLFWVVGVTAAFSILDHMDGLAGGIAAIASLFFAILAILDGQLLVATLGAALFGACLGFLRWNFNPAKIFMGDGGAMFLGFMTATLGLKLRLEHLPLTAQCLIPVLVLAVPIFDTTLVFISRARRGLIPPASPGKDHTAHRLANIGLSQRGAVLALYGVAVLGGILALLTRRFPLESPLLPAAVIALTATAAVAAFERLPYERQGAPKILI
jgi:UDP-GlcNAc:undecaprenyl-phosphate/decaprenyl-phosphate GlcNAc-1-phosphate transferase